MSRFMDQANELTAGLPEDHPAHRFVERVRQHEELVGDLPKHMALPQIAVLKHIVERPMNDPRRAVFVPPSVTVQEVVSRETDPVGWTEADTSTEPPEPDHDEGSWEDEIYHQYHTSDENGQAVIVTEHLTDSLSNLIEVLGPIEPIVAYRAVAQLLIQLMSMTVDDTLTLR